MDPKHLHLLLNEEIYLIDPVRERPSPSMSSNEDEPINPPKRTAPAPEIVTPKQIEPVALTDTLLIITEPLAAPERETLQKLVGALKLGYQPEIWENWTVEFGSHKRILIFGFSPNLKEKGIQPFAISPINQREIVSSPTLANLNANVTDKVKLWEVLKSWFGL